MLVVVALSTLLVSALCSLLEATLYSVRSASLEASLAQGHHRRAAEIFLTMKRNVATPTSAILILNTVANTAGAALCGMLAAQQFGAKAVPVFSALLTVGILMFSEILPKTTGAIHWRALWHLVVWPLAAIQTALKPLVWVTERLARVLTGVNKVPVTTEDEIMAMIHLGARHGELTTSELSLLKAVFLFDETLARDVVIPRQEIAALDVSWSLERCLEAVRASRHSRYPVCRGTLDDTVGILHVRDVIGIDPAGVSVESLARPLLHVPDALRVPELLRQMQSSRSHMALVHDERGTVVGAVTFENLVELIVGAVQDEFDEEESEWIEESPGVYLMSGQIPLARIDQELELRLDTPAVDTLAGLVVWQLDRIAKVGDRVELPGVEAEVVEVRGFRASRIRLSLREEESEPEASEVS